MTVHTHAVNLMDKGAGCRATTVAEETANEPNGCVEHGDHDRIDSARNMLEKDWRSSAANVA